MREYVIAFGIVAAVFAIATLIYVWASIFMESKNDNVTYALVCGTGKKKKKAEKKDLTWLWITAGAIGVATLGAIGLKKHAAKKRQNRERRMKRRMAGLWTVLVSK